MEKIAKAVLRYLFQEYLKGPAVLYSIALDIIYQLEKLELVTIIHEKGTINVALTTQGWHYAEKQGKSLFTLMAVA